MHVDRQRFLLLATALAGCRGEHLAPERVTVAVPAEVGRPGASEPIAAVAAAPIASEGRDDAVAADALRAACDALRAPAPFCEGLEDAKDLCMGYSDALEPDAAERAVGCLEALSGSEALCESGAVESCFLAATTVALIDASSAKPCAEIVQRCARSHWTSPELTQQSCQRALSAVRDALEPRLIACMDEGCGIARCVYDLADG